MNKDERSMQQNKPHTKAEYQKPAIKRIQLVAGEAVLGGCKYNNGVQAQCGLDGVCIDSTRRS